jgi:2,3-bisphosphoglycerate-dependent phosphoglycerate mutase
MSSIELVFETHSLTTDNERGIATGWHGGALSDRGRALALELGERRRDDGLGLVVVSDLARAVETARIAFHESDMPVLLDWRLREVDYGMLTGSHPDTLERERYVEAPFPGGESYHDATRRVDYFLHELAPAHPGERVLLIGHTATRWALDHLLGGRGLNAAVAAPFDWREGWEYVLSDRAVTEAAA